MMARNHFAIALFVFVLGLHTFLLNMGLEQKAIFFAFLMFASLLPDIDMPHSVLGRRIFPISNLLGFFARHRGIFHSIIFWLALSAIVWKFNSVVAGSLLLGTFLHIAADSITEEGTEAFWPLRFRVHGPIRTGSFVETVVFIIFLLGSGILIGRFFV